MSAPARILIALLLVAAGHAAAASGAHGTGRTLSRIAAAGKINVGYIPTPGTFAYRDASGATVGYSIDLCMKVIENIRKTVDKPDLQVTFRPLEAAQRIPLLKSGAIDIECGGNTNTTKRQQEVDFSHTFFNTGVRFLVRKPTFFAASGDLWKKRVAVAKGTTAQEVVDRLRSEQEVTPVYVDNDTAGLQLVEAGQADAFAQDDVLLYGLMANSSRRADLAVTGNFMTVEPYAFMLPKDDPEFRAVVDRTMIALMQSGEIVSIYRKWFDTGQLRIPMNIYMKENIKYPNKYGVPN